MDPLTEFEIPRKIFEIFSRTFQFGETLNLLSPSSQFVTSLNFQNFFQVKCKKILNYLRIFQFGESLEKVFAFVEFIHPLLWFPKIWPRKILKKILEKVREGGGIVRIRSNFGY